MNPVFSGGKYVKPYNYIMNFSRSLHIPLNALGLI